MADELNGQIKAVEAEIAEVKGEIKEDSAQLKLILAQLADPGLREERRPELLEEKRRLGMEIQRLGTREHDLRTEKELLLKKEDRLLSAKLQPPGVQNMFALSILYCRQLTEASIHCTHTLEAGLLSCHVP